MDKNLLKENNDLIKNSVIEDVILSKYEDRLNSGLFIDGNKGIKIGNYQTSSKNKEAILKLAEIALNS